MKTLVFLMILSLTSITYAGTGHGHSHGSGGHGHGSVKKSKIIGEKEAEKIARDKIRVLAFQEKVNASWNEAIRASAEIKDKKEWLVTFTNEKGIKGKTLYIFLKLDGEFIAANFTGK